MTKFFLIAASTVFTLAAGPVSARDATPSATPAEQPQSARTARPDQRYCVVYTMTGSRIPYKECQTRAQWLQEGFDPLNPGK